MHDFKDSPFFKMADEMARALAAKKPERWVDIRCCKVCHASDEETMGGSPWCAACLAECDAEGES